MTAQHDSNKFMRTARLVYEASVQVEHLLIERDNMVNNPETPWIIKTNEILQLCDALTGTNAPLYNIGYDCSTLEDLLSTLVNTLVHERFWHYETFRDNYLSTVDFNEYYFAWTNLSGTNRAPREWAHPTNGTRFFAHRDPTIIDAFIEYKKAHKEIWIIAPTVDELGVCNIVNLIEHDTTEIVSILNEYKKRQRDEQILKAKEVLAELTPEQNAAVFEVS